MGGQACVFYGAAQFSKDVDFLILADEINFAGLHRALAELSAGRIAVPRFDATVGHCSGEGACRSFSLPGQGG